MAKRLLEVSSDSSDASDNEVGGASIAPDFKVNEEFAKKFEYNKKREELARLEEKHGNSNANKRKREQNDIDDSESSSSEDEDDDGEFATAALDNEIFATLNAIKSKDPRIYQDEVTFYTDPEQTAPLKTTDGKTDKPVYLRDYHRQNLLNGGIAEDGQEDAEPMSYNQQQDQLKKDIVSEMHAAAAGSDASNSDDEGGLLVRKSKKVPAAVKKGKVTVDVEAADRDPETFLSNFMAARAWVPTDRAEMHPFESDDDEEEKRAEEFEEAYNLRFEDPEKSNEKLRSYARDTAERYSVRRDEKNSRKKKRDDQRAAKEAAKQELKEEKSRLKKLRMEEVEEKVKRIKSAGGLKTNDLRPEDWGHFIDEDWDDTRWEEEMQRRFGDQYYAENEGLSEQSDEGDAEAGVSKKKKKPKKPRFDDDIDIKDIVPDFKEEDEEAPDFSLSDDEGAHGVDKPKKKSKKQERIDRQKDSKKERRIIEQLVDDQLKLELDHALPASSRVKAAGFRYRQTSPESFGLTNRDILLADDTALNQYAGLKKLASWRDEEKKKKDKKHLGKKARLRKWRQETFGDEDGIENKDLVPPAQLNGVVGKDGSDDEMGGVDIREGGKKKKGRRRKKVKTGGEGTAVEV